MTRRGMDGWMDGCRGKTEGESDCIVKTNLCISGQSSQRVQGCPLQFHEPLPTQGSTRMDAGTAPHEDGRVVHFSCSFLSAMYP